MAQQPFTPAGVQAKQAELNALSQQNLQAQANLIRSNFQSWITNNFILNQTQQTYLNQANSEWIKLAAGLTAYAVENKLTVLLAVNGTPTTFKLIHISNSIVADNSPSGFTTSGTLTFTITYS
jgi:hypothetical protein